MPCMHKVGKRSKVSSTEREEGTSVGFEEGRERGKRTTKMWSKYKYALSQRNIEGLLLVDGGCSLRSARTRGTHELPSYILFCPFPSPAAISYRTRSGRTDETDERSVLVCQKISFFELGLFFTQRGKEGKRSPTSLGFDRI